MTLIIDAGPLVTLADRRDPGAPRLSALFAAERGRLIVSAQVTTEVDHLIEARLGRWVSDQFLKDLGEGRFEVACLEPQEYQAVARLSQQYRDLAPGLADLSIVVLAARFDTRRLVTFDQRHFRTMNPLQGGAFTLLPLDEG